MNFFVFSYAFCAVLTSECVLVIWWFSMSHYTFCRFVLSSLLKMYLIDVSFSCWFVWVRFGILLAISASVVLFGVIFCVDGGDIRMRMFAYKCVFGCVFCLSIFFFSFRLLFKTRACLVKCLYFCVACFCLLMSHLPFSIFHIPSSIFHLSSQNASILNSSFFIHSYNVNLFLYSQPHFGLFCFCCFFFVFFLSLWFVHCCSILHLQCGSLYIYFLFLFLISFLLFIIIISGWFKGPIINLPEYSYSLSVDCACIKHKNEYIVET